MAAPDPLISAVELERRIGKSVHKRIFDDNDVGEVDEPAELQLRREASSQVRAGLKSIPVERLVATDEEYGEELRRITLNVAHALCAIRNPSVIKIDAFGLMEMAEKDLLRIRNNQTTLSTNPDEDGSGGEGDGAGGSAESPFAISDGTSRGWDTDQGV